MNRAFQELIITGIFILVLILLLNPFGFFMPTELVYIMLGGVAILFAAYASFVLRETPRDEREQLHRFIANRSAYLWGSATIVVAIIYQGLTEGAIDPWLLIVLGVMVVAKVVSLYQSDRNH